MKKSIKLGVLLGLATCINVAYAQTNTSPMTLAEIAAQQNGKTFNDWEAPLYCTYITQATKIHVVAQAGKVPVAPTSNLVLSSTAAARLLAYGGNIPYIEVLQIPGTGKEGEWKQYTQGKFESPTGSNVKATYTPGGPTKTGITTGGITTVGTTTGGLNTGTGGLNTGTGGLNTGGTTTRGMQMYIYGQHIGLHQITNNVSHYNFTINTTTGGRNIALFPNGYYVSIGNSAKYIPGC